MIMKKLVVYIFTIGSILLSSSCADKLELNPYNALETSQAFETGSDFTNAIRGTYAGMVLGNASYYGGDFILIPDVLADNVLSCGAGRLTALTYHNWIYTANATTSIFNDGFRIIRRANAILENIETFIKNTEGTIPNTTFKTKDELTAFANNLKGEALAIRALTHFDMVRYFGKGFAFATDSDLGVPYVTSTDADALPPRETVKATYDKIVTDFLDAEKVIAASNGVGRLNKPAVQGLLSRVYLYRGEWQNCIDASTRCLTASASVGSIANFPNIWKDASTDGVLFKATITEKDNISVGVNYSQTSSAGTRSEYVVDFDLYQKYKAEDVRKGAYFVTTAFSGTTYNHISKNFGRATGRANVVDVKVIRNAEVLLNRAEAYAKVGGKDTEALADLNNLRKSRYTGFVNGTESGASLLTTILLERRLELAFEGHRFFDLKRLGLGVARSNFGDKSDGAGANNIAKTLEAGNFKFQLPLPQQEINTNSNIKQNPNY
jgi:starch-binding outer membrane protein, SusD/RagB family